MTLEWVKRHCQICGRLFEVPKDSSYQPVTCSSFDCVHKLLHPTLYNKGGDASKTSDNITLAKQGKYFEEEGS